MKIPDFYNKSNEIASDENKVCKLKKAIYGLKQSGRIWYEKLDQHLQEIGCKQLEHEPCMYLHKTTEYTLIIAIYVDDIIAASDSELCIKWFKEKMENKFEVRDIGTLKNFLGIKFNREEDGTVILTQSKFIQKVLKKFEMQDCNPVDNPMDPNVKLCKDMCAKTEDERREMANTPYQKLIGSLLYLAITTSPDIAFAVNTLSQYNNNYGKAHWAAAKRVLRYLKKTTNYGLFYRKSNDDLEGYADADWGSNIDDRKSFTGFFFNLSNGPISWEVRKQKTVALFSAESEYMSLADAAKEAIYLKNLLYELGVRINEAVTIYNDN